MNEAGTSLIHIGFSQMLWFFGALVILILSGLGALLQYFFQKDGRATEARFSLILEGQAEMKVEMTNAIAKIDAEVRALDRRVQQVELRQVENYIPRKEYDLAVQRIHERLDDIHNTLKNPPR